MQTDPAPAPTALDADTLAAMRDTARAAHSGGFIDPALFRQAQVRLPSVSRTWLETVIGRKITRGWMYLENFELALALTALDADAEHIESLKASDHAAWQKAAERGHAGHAAAAEKIRSEWAALRARLPVPVIVGHNWTARHLEGYEQGGNHIVVQAELTAGRPHRETGDCLCETPSTRHQLRHVERSDPGENRIPDCKACLRIADRIAGSNLIITVRR